MFSNLSGDAADDLSESLKRALILHSSSSMIQQFKFLTNMMAQHYLINLNLLGSVLLLLYKSVLDLCDLI